MKVNALFFPPLALGIAALASVPEDTRGYVLNGDALGLGQRDVRLFNNFEDATANDSTATHVEFPGYDGAEMAVWKAVVEWGSELHGTGDGDPSQNDDVGSGGALFDPSWQGGTTAVGGVNDNIASAIPMSDGGLTLAYAEGPYDNGWRIRFYENHIWQDNPGTALPFNQEDIQGIMTHEYGHCVGLGHSNNNNATMFGTSSNSIADRSIHADDIAGIQDAYGLVNMIKPHVTGTAIGDGIITVIGSNFDATGNEIWFTKKGLGSNGTPIKVTGVDSTDGGTRLVAVIPGNAGPGDVLVKLPGSGGGKLSNAWPFDTDLVPAGPPSIISMVPSQVTAVVDGEQVVGIGGNNFTGAEMVTVDGVALDRLSSPPEWTLLSDREIQIRNMPLVSSLTAFGTIDVEVTTSAGVDSAEITVVACYPPVLEIDDPNIVQATGVRLTTGADFGDIGFLLVSPDLLPSDFGSFTLDIGNGGASLINTGVLLFFQEGWTEVFFGPLSGLSMGQSFYWQSLIARSTNNYNLPWDVSNTVASTIAQ